MVGGGRLSAPVSPRVGDANTDRVLQNHEQRLRQLGSVFDALSPVEFNYQESPITLPHRLGRRPKGIISTCGAEFRIIKSDARMMTLAPVLSWSLVGHETVASATNQVDFDDLDGDLDIAYKLVSHIITNGSGGAYTLLWNGSAAPSSDSQRHQVNNATTAESDEADWTFAEFSSPQAHLITEIHAKSGQYRFFHNRGTAGTTGPDNALHFYSGHSTDTSTVITQISVAQAASEIGAGSEFWLYARGYRSPKASVVVF